MARTMRFDKVAQAKGGRDKQSCGPCWMCWHGKVPKRVMAHKPRRRREQRAWRREYEQN